jgi:murein tripeptide amidase MpaA
MAITRAMPPSSKWPPPPPHHPLPPQNKAQHFIRTRDICLTLAGNRCELLTITTVATDPSEMVNRPAVVLSARVHPGESNSSFMIRGVLRFLCSDNPDAKVLRDNFVWKIVPMLNPDGVVHGNYRCSLSGMDLNRRYSNPSPILHPTIFSMRQLLSTTQESRGVLLFVDMHGHSRKKNTFLYVQYGCRDGDHGWRAREEYR